MDPLRGASWRLLDPPKFKVYLGNPHVGRVLGLCIIIYNYFSDLEPSKYLLSLFKYNKTNTTVLYIFISSEATINRFSNLTRL